MTSTTFEEVSSHEAGHKLGAKELRDFGHAILSPLRAGVHAVGRGQINFEAAVTQLVASPEELQEAADNDRLPYKVRDRLLAKRAIQPHFEVHSPDFAEAA